MRHKKVLVLSRYAKNGASSRLRFFQYFDFLSDNGYEFFVKPFFTYDDLSYFYKFGHKKIQYILAAYFKRLIALLKTNKYDLIWIEKEVFPFFPDLIFKYINYRNVPYIVDYDDAIFHNYDNHPLYAVRKLLANKLNPLIRGASAITVGNSYLADHMRSIVGDEKVINVPTVIDINKYELLSEECTDEFKIGWVGAPVTSKYLDIIKPVLNKLNKTQKIKLVLVGAGDVSGFDCPLEKHSWSEDTESKIISTFNVGIMPLFNKPWEQGKCGYKLIQYMACGRAVVASPVGVNNDIVTSGENGFLASSQEEWFDALKTLSLNNELRKKMGLTNRRKVEDFYSKQTQQNRILAIFSSIT